MKFEMALLAAWLLASTGMLAQNEQVAEAFRQGAAALHEGQNAAAEQAFRDAVRLAPKMPEAHLDLGLVLEREGKQDEAIAALQQATALDAKLASAHMFLGIFLYQANRQEEALTELRSELALNPRNGEALMWLGIVELAGGHPELAVGPFDTAAELAPNDLNLLEYRGRAHSQVARDSYAQMARLNPDAWQVHKVRAELAAEEGRGPDAIAEYKLALAKQPGNPDLYEGLGDEYRKMNQLEDAATTYGEELKLAPQNPIALYNMGSTAIERGDSAAGVPLLQAMVRLYRHSAVAEYYLGRGLAAESKDAEAVSWLEQSAHEDPTGEVGKRSWYELARVYRKLRRPADAQKAQAEYTRLREAEETRSAKQVEDWRKLGQAAP